MTDHRDTEPAREQLRDELHALVEAGLTDVDTSSLERSSRRRAMGAVRARVQQPERSRFRGRGVRTLTAAAAFAAAALIAIAVAPDGSDEGSGRGERVVGAITPSASAAEALDQAGVAVVRETQPAGTGPVWHGVSRSYVDGELTSITEQWFDADANTYLAAAWGDQRTSDQQREILQVVGVDERDTSRLRTYDRASSDDDWSIPEELPTPHLVQELPAGYGAGQRRLSTAVHEWLDVFAASPTDQELVDATWAFGAAIADDYFGGSAPQFSQETMAMVPDEGGVVEGEAQEAMEREWKAGQDALRIRPMIYLLTTVQSTPEATQALYGQIGRFDSLERLPDATIDGRPVTRIRYDPVDIGSYRERVLVLDAETGVPLRTESVDRSSWTEIESARRVAKLGDESVLCEDDVVPCDLLFGRGDAADAWLEHIRSDIGRRETQMMKDPNNAFSIATPLRPQAPDDGVYGAFTGECARDARMLSVCRG